MHKTHINQSDGLATRHTNSTFIAENQEVYILSENKLGLLKNHLVKNEVISSTFSNKGFNRALEDNLGNLWLSENVQWYSDFEALRVLIYKPKSHEFVTLSDYINKNLSVYSLAVDPVDSQVYYWIP